MPLGERARRNNAPGVALWRSPALGGTQLLAGCFADYAYDPHTHESACFALITDGAIRIRVRGSEFVARKGDLFAIEADGVHAGWPADPLGWKQRALYVRHEQLVDALGAGTRAAGEALAAPLIRDAPLTTIFLQLHRLSESASLLECEESCVQFAARLFRRHMRQPAELRPGGREESAVRLVKDYLECNLTARTSLSDLAAMAHMPPFRLFRAFAGSVGAPPHAWQRQARIRCATRLIRQGFSLREVAATSGFSDQAHMTRAFRRTLGVTPGAYRAAFR